MADKEHFDYLPTTPATQVMFMTSKPWCMGHGRWPWWLHHAGHRLGLLRLKDGPPMEYIDG